MHRDFGFWALDQLSKSDPLRIILGFWALSNISKSDPLMTKALTLSLTFTNFLRCSLQSLTVSSNTQVTN